MSTLVLLRHGQAAFGADNYDELSVLGVEQAVATGKYWASQKVAFSRSFVGPRERHRRTARAAMQLLGSNSGQSAETPEPALDEFAEGSTILASAARRFALPLTSPGAMPRQERLRRYSDEIDAWSADEIRIEGVERAAEFRRRVADWLLHVTTDSDASGQRLLAVTSAGVIAAVVVEMLDLPDRSIAQFTRVLRNCSLTEVVFSGARRSLLSFNCVAHLPDSLHTYI